MSTTRPFFMLCVLASLILGIGLYANTVQPRALTPEVTAGMNIWRAQGCEGCHTLYGQGGPYAPDLTSIYQRRGAAYLREVWDNPGAFHPGLTKTESDSLIAFLQWIGEQNPNWPPRPIRFSGQLSGER